MQVGAASSRIAPCRRKSGRIFGRHLTLGVLLFLATAGWAADSSWELLSRADGIRVYQKAQRGEGTISLRGEAIIPARLKDIALVMTDNGLAHLWVPMVAERRTLQVIGPFERIEYTHLAMPWPLTDRYFVNHGRAEELADGSLRLYVKSVDQPSYRDDSKVLGILHYSEFLLTPVGDGKRTQLTLEVNSDPRGSIPTWLVNRAQRRWPRDFIQGLIGQLEQKKLLQNAAADPNELAPKP